MRVGSVEGVSYTSHCCRVGTCTALLSMGMPLELLNAHVGWAQRSEAALGVYHRPGTQLAAFDQDFYFAALPVA